MKRLLQQCLLAAAAALPLPGLTSDPYPSKPVTVVVPYAPGGATDVVARIFSRHFSDALHQPFVVDNKPGASGTIAMNYVAKAAPDGHTLLAAEITMTVVPALFDELPFDPVKDLVPLVQIAEAPYVLVVNPKVAAKNLKELIALAKQKPGELTYASGGAGSGPHVAGELLKSLAGVDIRHIPYKGSGPALNDVLGGQVDMLLTAAPAAAGFVSSGRLRPLAVTSAKRLPMMASVPTASEAGLPGFNFANWFGVVAPRGTPAAVGATLRAKVKDMLGNPETVAKLEALGAIPAELGPEDFTKRVASETQRWSALIRKSGITRND